MSADGGTARTGHRAWARQYRPTERRSWARDYLGPWINRRLHGTSSGDGLTAKRPSLRPVTPPIVM